MAEDGYTAGPFETDAATLVERARVDFVDRFPNASLPPASFLAWDVETDANTAVDIGQLALTVEESVTIDVLGRLLQEPRRQATPAAGAATFQVTGDTAVLVPAGTILEGTGPDGEAVSVETVAPASAGIGVTEIAGVPVQTLQTGEAANGGSGVLLGLDQWPWGISAELDAPLAGGADEEEAIDHLVRLVRLARITAPRPITPDDISEFVTLKVPGVAAALTLPETDPGPPLDTNVAGHFTTAIRGADGTAPVGDVVDAAQDALDAALVATAVAHVVTADYTTVDVDATVYAWPGYDKTVMKAQAEDIITAYLSPATWGNPPMLGDVAGTGAPSWAQTTDVYRAEIIEQLGRVRGADRGSMTVTINGAAADFALTGLFPLPLPGDIDVTVLDR